MKINEHENRTFSYPSFLQIHFYRIRKPGTSSTQIQALMILLYITDQLELLARALIFQVLLVIQCW